MVSPSKIHGKYAPVTKPLQTPRQTFYLHIINPVGRHPATNPPPEIQQVDIDVPK